MDTAKSHEYFLAGFFFFMFLGDLTEACSCMEAPLQKICCRAGFVMRTRFMSVKLDPKSPSYKRMNIYTIQPTEVYKGPGNVRNAQFLYTAESESYCGYQHKGPLQGDDYVISGSIDEDRLKISSCGFAKPWGEVTSEEKKILTKDGKGCSASCP